MPIADALYCERIARRHARTFALASYFLPPHKRRAAFALYAFCRVADDVVDIAAPGDDTDIARALSEYERALQEALAGAPGGPVFRELFLAVQEHGVPPRVLHELVSGVARDLVPARYESWAELAEYCEGVASTVGEMCTYVFGVPAGSDARQRALQHARTLGVAMQLTNILRDVGEDAQRGRCYLPLEDLDHFDIAVNEVLGGSLSAGDARWRSLMAFEIARARELYCAAQPGIGLLAPDSQRCASACSIGYARILDEIEALHFDTLHHRACLGQVARARVLFGVWRARPRLVDASAVAAASAVVLVAPPVHHIHSLPA